jgi:hypothetical protein
VVFNEHVRVPPGRHGFESSQAVANSVDHVHSSNVHFYEFPAKACRRLQPDSWRAPSGRALFAALTETAGCRLGQSVAIPRAKVHPSPEAVGPASRLRRRYADAPAAAFLTGLGADGRPPLRSRPYAHFSSLVGDIKFPRRTSSCTAALRWYQGQALRALRGLDIAGRRRAIKRAGSGEKCPLCATREKGSGRAARPCLCMSRVVE